MELLLKDLLHSNFNQHTNKFTTVTFVDGYTFEEFKFDHLSYDSMANSLRILLKK